MYSKEKSLEITRYALEHGKDMAAKKFHVLVSSVNREMRRCRHEGYIAPTETMGKSSHPEPRILVFDIETAPSLAYIWKCYDENISPSQMRSHTVLLSWAAKWLGEEKVMVDSTEKDKDDRRVCETIWNLFNEADIVVAHNGKAFDSRTLNTRWLQLGLKPPSPYKVVDTLMMAKAVFRFGINKLDYIAQFLGVGKKTEHEGFDLWTKCMVGDPDAWNRMREYNINDVLILEEIYLRMRAWDKKHPNVSLMYMDERKRCTVCGSQNITLIKQMSYTSAQAYTSYQCDNCGHIMRGFTPEPLQEKVLRSTM